MLCNGGFSLPLCFLSFCGETEESRFSLMRFHAGRRAVALCKTEYPIERIGQEARQSALTLQSDAVDFGEFFRRQRRGTDNTEVV